MMDKFLTTETFRTGLTAYLTELQYDAAEQDDLWAALTLAGHQSGKLPADLDVKAVMDTWILQVL